MPEGLAAIDDVDRTPDRVHRTAAGTEYHSADCPSIARAYDSTELEVGVDARFSGRTLYDRSRRETLDRCDRCGGGFHG